VAFAYSWAFWGAAIASGQEWTEFPTVLLYVLGGIGPSLVVVVLVHLGFSPESAAAFWRRVYERGRIGAVWYIAIAAIAVLPNLLAKIVPAGSVSGADEEVALIAILPVAVLAGLAEELGWRGYLLDRLLSTSPVVAAGRPCLDGLAPALLLHRWHGSERGPGLWSQDFWFDMANRVPLAVLFAWVYVNTARSILSAVLLHAADNISSVLISPEGDQLIVRLVVVIVLAAAAVVSLRKPAPSG
jgi:membrane protease YdiL (CAAX protease family)